MIALLIPLLGAMPHIILGVESLFGHHTGTQKKQVAMGILGDLVNLITSENGQPGANSPFMTFLGESIDSMVKLLNDTGVMTHANQPKPREDA